MSITERIRRITADLSALEVEMSRIANQGVSSAKGAALVDELLTEDLIHDFKGAVDHMRHFLWSYIEAVSEGHGNDVENALATYRMLRVTEMLRVLEEPLRRTPPGNAESTFIEQVLRTASLASQKRGGKGQK